MLPYLSPGGRDSNVFSDDHCANAIIFFSIIFFQELNPPLRMIFLVLPLVSLQSMAFLLTLSLAATYLRVYVILCVAAIVAFNLAALRSDFTNTYLHMYWKS
jgi:hypothetical protein